MIPLTYDEWLIRFPQFVDLPETTFDLLMIEATVEMGNPTRWGDAYKIAQSYLLAHFAALAESYESGDHSPLQPYREKEVDDVRVEYAVSRDMQNNLDPYLSTTYGQQYIKWRRMMFAGPRVV